jgi:hypothetical protein
VNRHSKHRYNPGARSPEPETPKLFQYEIYKRGVDWNEKN